MTSEETNPLPDIGPYRPMPMENMFAPFVYSGLVKTFLFAAMLPAFRYYMNTHMSQPGADSIAWPFPPLPDALLPTIAVLLAPAACAALGVLLGLIAIRYGAAHADRHRDAIARGAIEYSLWRSGSNRAEWGVIGPWMLLLVAPVVAAVIVCFAVPSIWLALCLAAISCGHLITARAFRPAFQRIDVRVTQLLDDRSRANPR